MSRSTRLEFPGAVYHIVGKTIAGAESFTDDTERMRFLDLIGEWVDSGDLAIHAFCLLSNHYHLLAETPRGQLSRWMHRIAGEFAQWFNFRHGRSGVLWQGRYKALIVEGGPYLLECSRYIHLNPNRAGLSNLPERWKWSSYRNYVGEGKPVVPWVTTRVVLGEIGGSGKAAAAAYRQYVEAGQGGEPVSPFERATAGLVLGGETFVAWVRDNLKARPLNEDEPTLRRFRDTVLPDPEKVEQAVIAEFGEARRKGLERRILAAMLVQYAGLRPSEVARRLGVTRAAVAKSVIREERPFPFESSIERRMRKVAARLAGK